MPASSKISKRSSPEVRRLIDVREGRDKGAVFCEGWKIVSELLDEGIRPERVYVTEENVRRFKERLASAGLKGGAGVTVLDGHVMAFASDVSTPPGVIAVVRRPRSALPAVAAGETPIYLVLHGVQLPQNVGALVRTAEAAGCAAVLTTGPTADPFAPKSVRGAMGSVFRIPVLTGLSLDAAAAMFRARSVRTVGTRARAGTPYDQFDWNRPAALVVGSEGAGLAPAEEAVLDERVTIPMAGRIDSLNVGTAAAICLFEASRARRRGNEL